MEPGPHGREEDVFKGSFRLSQRAAMEPGPHGREERSASLTLRRRITRRNGARPSRPGRGSLRACRIDAADRPQWSPALTAGKSSAPRSAPRCPPTAAMEPGPHGREEVWQMTPEEIAIEAAMEPGPHGREEQTPRASC